jgi:hypothetical protein
MLAAPPLGGGPQTRRAGPRKGGGTRDIKAKRSDGHAPDPSATVFVVDDDVSVRESLEGLIREAGFRVEIFASAQEFLDRGHPGASSCGCAVPVGV